MEIAAPSKGKKGACAACGDSPVPHLPTFLFNALELFFVNSAERLESNALTRALAPLRRAADALADALPRLLCALSLARLSRDPERACSYRSQVIWEEATARGLVMEQLIVFGVPTELYRAQHSGSTTFFHSLPIPSRAWSDLFPGIDDKSRLKEFLARRGVPVSRAERARTLREAQAAFGRLRAPLVVKPRMGSRARHTTTNIHTPHDLESAFRLAQVLCPEVLLEEHLEGAVSRATVVDGVLRGFLQMFPARVVGDGTRSIAELVVAKNATRHPRVGAIVLDDEHRAYLARSGYTEASILPSGTEIDLSRRTGRFEGGRTREMLDTVHPKLRDLVERAARELHAPIVGFDLIIPDPEGDPDNQRWGILEANSLPYIDLHHAPLEGTPSNVARAVWDIAHVPMIK